MKRTVKIFALYLFIGIPVVMLLFPLVGPDVLDALFWRAAVVIFLFLMWRGVMALEQRAKE